ncbi:MAG: helix-turn-helix domain-containing protein [Proteobacteria bacterium]|nr:helix-turn-helix domain-containing protein [Pseudomonadota bacterium]
MAMQLREASVDNVIIPVAKGIGYAQPSLEVLSCCSCNIRGGCLAEQLTIAHDHSYQVVKNRKALSKGSHIFRGGDDTKAIYVVSSGSIKSYMLMENGEEQVVNFYLPGDVFGLDAMGSNSHISSTVALEATTICKIPLAGLQDRVLGQGFLNIISDNLLRDHNQMLILARKDAEGRLASFLIDMSKRMEKYGCQAEDYSVEVIKLTMTRQDIANYLGLAIETVSRVLRRFQDSGMLEVTCRKVKVFDYNCLVAIAGAQVIS